MTELQKYSTNDLIEISKNNVFAIQAMQDGMKAINREVTKLKISKDEHEERLNYLENTSEITNSQAKQLQEEVKKHAYKVEIGEMTEEGVTIKFRVA